MKKILICLMTVLAFSCSLSEDNPTRLSSEVLPVFSVSMPEHFVFGQTYEINLTYILPTDCHFYNDVYYQKEGNERIIAILSSVLPNTGCQETFAEADVTFSLPINDQENYDMGYYIFKFWQGKDDNGLDIYLTMEVPVE